MNTVEKLDAAIQLARRHGFVVHYDLLDGAEAGACMVGGQQRLYLDLTQSPAEQLETVVTVLADVDDLDMADVPEPLVRLISGS